MNMRSKKIRALFNLKSCFVQKAALLHNVLTSFSSVYLQKINTDPFWFPAYIAWPKFIFMGCLTMRAPIAGAIKKKMAAQYIMIGFCWADDPCHFHLRIIIGATTDFNTCAPNRIALLKLGLLNGNFFTDHCLFLIRIFCMTDGALISYHAPDNLFHRTLLEIEKLRCKKHVIILR